MITILSDESIYPVTRTLVSIAISGAPVVYDTGKLAGVIFDGADIIHITAGDN